MKRLTLFAATYIVALASTGAFAQFVPGHVFVAVTSGEGCFNAEFEGILEIDPNSGEGTTFADPSDGLCFPDGLTFTPLGDRLLVSNFGLYFEDLGWIQSFASNGSSSILLDGEDGLANPSGFNNIAYDRQRSLYVVTGDNWYIMRYTPEGTSEIFADANDGVIFQGSIAVAPNGDVFFCSYRTDEVIRITPDGVGILFDVLEGPRSIATDRRGNLYVGAAGSQIYVYSGAVSANRELLGSGYGFGVRALVVAPDESRLYVAATRSEGTLMGLYVIDLSDGTAELLAASSQGIPYGIAVHVNYLADVDDDRDIDVRDFAILSNLPIDLNGDGEVNDADFAVLISTLTGP